MGTSSERWTAVTEPRSPREQEALEHVRTGLPPGEPHRAWASFELMAEDGALYEVHLLVVTPKGIFLIEVEGRPGVVTGDASTWSWSDGPRITSTDNPLLLASRKARKLSLLLAGQRAARGAQLPPIEPVVFLSAPGVETRLDEQGRQGVCVRGAGTGPTPGILHALTWLGAGQGRVDAELSRTVARALEQAGVRRAPRARRIGDYVLGPLLAEGPGWQEFEATHASLARIRRALRLYNVPRDAGPDVREGIVRTARREFELLEGVRHPAILRPEAFTESDLGPALIFEHEPDAARLDHVLRERGERLDAEARLGLLREVVEAVAFAHSRRVVHRALAPHAVLVGAEPDSGAPRVRLGHWQVALGPAGSGRSRTRTGTAHPDERVEAAARVYMAPEAQTDPSLADEAADVFSIGALAYLLFAGRPPATTPLELHDKLRRGGLLLSEATDAAPPSLVELVRFCTHPDVSLRHALRDVADGLEVVLDELTTPACEVADLTAARRGDRLPGGFEVLRRLGSGSSAVAYLVEREGRRSVLKLSLGAEHDRTLDEEGQVLARLRHPGIVAFEERVVVGGRTGLLLAPAGDETLRDWLRRDGRIGLELLGRFGEELLQVVSHLEAQGIAHRDLKPENCGVSVQGPSGEHLVVFDFSLSRAPRERLGAGTPGYLDPFLRSRRPARWDEAAERFSAAVVLHEMATGRLPRWGDGRSDPAQLADEVTIDADSIDAAIRTDLAELLGRALRRDASARFPTAEDLLRAWRAVFEGVVGSGAPTDRAALTAAIAAATLDTTVAALPLGAPAQDALERLGVTTVQDALRLPAIELQRLRGVGTVTRQALLRTLDRLAARFPAQDPLSRDGPPRRRGRQRAPAVDEPPEDPAATLDRIAARLLLPPRGRSSEADARAREVISLVLGLDPRAATDAEPWPGQAAVAALVGVTRARVSQLVSDARARWGASSALAAVRDELVELVAVSGGVAAVTELERVLLSRRGAAGDATAGMRAARAVVRAALEVEGIQPTARLALRRGPPSLVAVEAETEAGPEAEELLDHAQRLGTCADALATAAADESAPFPSPGQVEAALRALPSPAGTPSLPADRLVRLAAAASRHAVASSRLELYPRGLPARRALTLGRGLLSSVQALGEDELRARIAARFPEAEPLPSRPALDQLLRGVGLSLDWSDSAGRYQHPSILSGGLGSAALSRRTTTARAPEAIDQALLEERLSRAAEAGGLLVLVTSTTARPAAEDRLAAWRLTARRLDVLLVGALRATAARRRVDWERLVDADREGPGGRHWPRLAQLVEEALEQTVRDLLDTPGLVLLTDLELLARFGRLDLLERLRDRLANPASARAVLRGAWVLVLQDEQRSSMPTLGGQALPVLGPAEWLRLPQRWLEASRHTA